MWAAGQFCRIILAAIETAMRAFTVMLMVRKQLVLRAMHQSPRSRKHEALARSASTQHGDLRSVQQPRQLALALLQDATDSDSPQAASESEVGQDDAGLDAHADSVTDAIAEMNASADEEADADAGGNACAALPTGGASKRKHGCPRNEASPPSRQSRPRLSARAWHIRVQ
jgi:hypothetical protein